MDVAQPSQLSLFQESEHAGNPCTPAYLCVRYFVMPCDAQHPPEAAEVDVVLSLLLTCIGCASCFATVEKGAEDACLVNTEFCVLRQLTICSNPLAES